MVEIASRTLELRRIAIGLRLSERVLKYSRTGKRREGGSLIPRWVLVTCYRDIASTELTDEFVIFNDGNTATPGLSKNVKGLQSRAGDRSRDYLAPAKTFVPKTAIAEKLKFSRT